MPPPRGRFSGILGPCAGDLAAGPGSWSFFFFFCVAGLQPGCRFLKAVHGAYVGLLEEGLRN